MITWDTVKMHKHRKYKKKLLKTKYRNNDYKKKLVNCTKNNSRTFPTQNSENSKFQDKFQDRKKFQEISRIF